MWVKIGPFPDEYSAYFSEIAGFLDKRKIKACVERYVSVHGAEHYVILADLDSNTFEEVKRICELTGLVATRASEPKTDPIADEVSSLLRVALCHIQNDKKEEAVRWIARAIRIVNNHDEIADKIRAFIEASKQNTWLKGELSFWEVDDVEELIRDLKGCWTVGTAFIWKDFCFAEQCNCCGEYAVFKYSNGKAFQFESITVPWMSTEKLRDFLNRISRATDEQLIRLEY